MDWALPKSVFSTNESTAKEEVEIKEEDQDDDDEEEESVKDLTSGGSSCGIQAVDIKKEPLSDESEDKDDPDSKSDTNGSSDSEEEEEEDRDE